MNGIRYNNRFFATEEEAKAFRKQNKRGAILHLTPRSRKETRRNFYAEVSVAWDARREEVDPEKTPWCVAWNEF